MKFKIFLLLSLYLTGMIMKLESTPVINENQLKIIYRNNGILNNLKIPPLKFEFPKIETISISPYETLYLYKDNTLPLIHLNLIIEGGILQENNEERGLYSLLLDLWENGGAKGKSGEEISEMLAELGVELHFNLQQEFISIEMYCLKHNFKQAFQLLEDILLYPEFSENKLKTLKLRYIDSIQRRNDKPDQIAGRKLKEIMEYPNKITESINKEDIEKITRDKILKAYKSILKHRRLHIALDGDISEIDYHTIFLNLSQKLGSIEKPFIIKDQNIQPSGIKEIKNKIILVKKDVPQAVIVMGKFLPSYKSYETFPLRIANYILGGGSFVSKMMREIRVKRGLAYYAYSSTRFGSHYGKFITASGTNSKQAQETTKIMLDLISNFENLLTDDDIIIAKDALINSHIFEFSNPSKILYLYIIEKIYNPPESYIIKYPQIIQQISKQEILNIYNKYFKQNDLWIIIVGPESLKKSLEKLQMKVIIIEPETNVESIIK
ncbi:MAG: peptidase M16 [Leptospiraceae bacterium]|nr:MAG: peptidase M16 [Leptospiraceae bacterium]